MRKTKRRMSLYWSMVHKNLIGVPLDKAEENNKYFYTNVKLPNFEE